MGICSPDNCVTVQISTRVDSTFFAQKKPLNYHHLKFDRYSVYIFYVCVLYLEFEMCSVRILAALSVL